MGECIAKINQRHIKKYDCFVTIDVLFVDIVNGISRFSLGHTQAIITIIIIIIIIFIITIIIIIVIINNSSISIIHLFDVDWSKNLYNKKCLHSSSYTTQW